MDFNSGFDGSLGIILDNILNNEFSNMNVPELLFLLLITLVSLLKNVDKSKTALFNQKIDVFGFDNNIK